MPTPTRFVALDVHKHYFVAVGVNRDKQTVYGPRKLSNYELEEWIGKVLTPEDAVVLEMTTNAYTFHDALEPHVHSVTVAHPPHVALITRSPVMNDKKAAAILAHELADNRLVGVWIPPQEVRDLRALVAQRRKMSSLASTAKNRLHSALHRHHFKLPPGSQPFDPKHKDFWLNLPVSSIERINIRSNWETVEFAERQKAMLEEEIARFAAEDERVPLLVQLPGIGLMTAVTLLAAIGDIRRFPADKKLVGYAGLGARVHDSGQTTRTGRVTKAGRKDIRYAMVQAANHAVRCHPHWKREFTRLERRLGRSKAIVAIARRLLVAVWHVLTEECADRFADPTKVACSLFKHAYDVGVRNLPNDMSALAYTRYHLDRLKLGQELTHLPWGSKTFKLPPSSLAG
jgi:transposase